jgi:endonuclease-8
MPEGDTIHKIATELRSTLLDETIRQAKIRPRPKAAPLPAAAQSSLLTGRQVSSVRAHGRHLLIELDDGLVIRNHLGMYGSWHG